ncbi:hypothetical protein MKW94_029511 [Papaver nudicaule]|uniref:F-box domain-containing protein n=1 Tax=Papaver nudicaule TaxID=74823 RepID=A0AA41V0P2_PAPNU|nr:hypothetical protein [Papaver nudicaule]
MDANEMKPQKLVEQLKRLPEETILEILGKLPLRDLLVFRCVSKPWCIKLDNNPEFVHMTRNNFSLMLIDETKILCSLDNNTLSSSLSNGIDGCVEEVHCPLVPLGWNLEVTSFVGTCNGLFCMYSEEDKERFCLWNPCTNEIRFLPRAGFRRIEVNMRFALVRGHGFGYDSKSDDYKYVRIFYPKNGSEVSEVHIYSFRANTWKLRYVPYELNNVVRDNRAPNGVFYNGALHWIARRIGFGSYYPKVLLAFDMTEENVREIPQPENVVVTEMGNTYVDVLDGCLCILYDSAGFQVWVMKDYGMRQSWTMRYNISKPTVFEFRSVVDLRKIECLKTGEILLEFHSWEYETSTAALILYDPKNESLTVLKDLKEFQLANLRSVFHRYVKSLVKLNSEPYIGEG